MKSPKSAFKTEFKVLAVKRVKHGQSSNSATKGRP
jgi:hypothetical protein